MKRTVVIDIETVALPTDDFSETVQEYISRKFARQRSFKTLEDMMCLDSDFGKIVCVGIMKDEGAIVKALEEESELLKIVWDILGETKPIKVVTFNGKAFDIPFILKRSAYNKIKPSIEIPVAKYATKPHMDLGEILSGFDKYRMKKLDIYCELFGIEHKTESGAMVKKWFEEGDFKAIKNHCLEDIKATKELYKRIKNYL